MKKIFFLFLMAAAILCTSCLTETQTDILYEVKARMMSYSTQGFTDGVAFQAKDEFSKLVKEFSDQYGQEWVVSCKSGAMYNRAEKDAVATYEAALKKFSELHDGFVAKYANVPSDGSEFKAVYTVCLKRFDPDKGDEMVRESEEFVFEVR